ncbi:hypothetical protein GCM10020218_035310 [Dactylosporangium vinaceum]
MSRPPAERAPHDRADALVAAERQQLPLVVAADEGVVDLVRHVPAAAVPVGHGQRLHELPAGEVRRAQVADLAGGHEIVERAHDLLDRRPGVERVQLIQVDVLRAEPAQRRVDGPDQPRP